MTPWHKSTDKRKANAMNKASVRSFSRGALVGTGCVCLTALILSLLGASSRAATAGTSAPPTVGPFPSNAFLPNGNVDTSRVPVWIPDLDRQGGVAGYSRTQDMYPTANPPPSAPPDAINSYRAPTQQDQANVNAALIIPVYGPDLQTIVGHMYPNKGFVPIGQSPDSVPDVPNSSSSSPAFGQAPP